jgi:hypothetical protein
MHVVKTVNDVDSKFPRLRSHGPRSFGTFFGFVSADTDIHNLIQTLDARSEVFNALGHLPFFIRPLMKYFVFDPFWCGGLRVLFESGCCRHQCVPKAHLPIEIFLVFEERSDGLFIEC